MIAETFAPAGPTRRRLARLVVLAVIALVAGLITGMPVDGSELGPGCAPKRTTVTHRAGGKVLERAPARVACATETGYFTGETTIGVTDEGTVWFSAADWEWALVRSRDNGASWERFAVPGPQAYPGCGGGTSPVHPCDDSQQGKYNTVADAFLWVDPGTSKIFWAKTYGFAMCSSMNMSADDGATWEPVTQFACPGGDYEKIAGGPAPEGGAQPRGYPNVLYACTNGPAPTFVVGPSRVCYKSLDGGTTWNSAGVPVTPTPLAPGCLHFQETQTVGPDGTVFLPLGCALDTSRVMVAISHDEAATWEYVDVPVDGVGNNAGLIGGVSVAVDAAGVLYVVWTGADDRVYLASTPDKGATWKGPSMVSAPGVTTVAPRAQVAAREPGHIAIAYYGYPRGGSPSAVHGYLTESFNAAAKKPTLHSARLNHAKDPLYFPTDGGTLPRNDYLGVTIAPDGTPWTALVKLTSAKSDEEGFIQSTGFAGRLVDAPRR
jgi:hypothetical protein